jgi:pyruvate/2-oxoglutarate dehydrogenase complex dihydrolipoamide acyltransferase (E2) component
MVTVAGRHFSKTSVVEIGDEEMARIGGELRGSAFLVVEEAPRAEAMAEIAATDSARELAHEAGIDLRQMDGTGAAGRIVKADVEAAIDAQEELALDALEEVVDGHG